MGSTSGGNQTTRTEPPKYQLPYLQDSLGYAQNQYLSSGGANRVAPLSGETEQALTGIATRANNGSAITNASRGLATNTLNGGFLGSNPYMAQLGQFSGQANPHLDATFEQARLASQNGLQSEFAGRGRNVEAGEGLRAQQLGNLATSIYGGAYENDRNRALQATGMQAGLYGDERNRQQQVLGMSGALAGQDYADFDRLAGVGATREGFTQEGLDAPGNALDDYIRRISGNMGQTTITPTTRNRAGGAAGGAMLGSALGPWGALGGGILGGLFG